MSVDKLQERIRKLKNPSVVDFDILPEYIPPHIKERDGSFVTAYEYFCTELLRGLKNVVPAVRFSFSTLALYGPEGIIVLRNLLETARKMGFYIFLDCPDAFSVQRAQHSAEILLDEAYPMHFDSLILSTYIGSDGLRPYCAKLEGTQKSVFALVRTANKTAPELQDLLIGTRLVYMATADMVNRLAETAVGRSGYSQVAAVAPASSADTLSALRSKYKTMFFLLDGYDYPNANAKKCSNGFDRLGHGAAACAGISITAAWRDFPADEQDFVRFAVEAAERMKKNLTRYITIL